MTRAYIKCYLICNFTSVKYDIKYLPILQFITKILFPSPQIGSIYLVHRPALCTLTHLCSWCRCSGAMSASSIPVSHEDSVSCLPALKQMWLQKHLHTAAISNKLLWRNFCLKQKRKKKTKNKRWYLKRLSSLHQSAEEEGQERTT